MSLTPTTVSRRRNRSLEEEYVPPMRFPTPPQSLQPGQPLAKRQRRIGNRTTEEDGQPLTIVLPFESQFDIVNEDFRTIGPVYLPLPVKDAAAPQDIRKFWQTSLKSLVAGILNSHGIDSSKTYIVRRTSVNSFNLLVESATTIMVGADKDDAPGDQWYRAADSILKLCLELNLSGVNVEIADGRGLIRNVSKTVDPKHELVGDWLDKKKAMFYRVMKALQNNTTWVNISVLSRGREIPHPKHTAADLFKPTIVIGIRQDSEETWTEQAKGIEKLIHPYYPTVAVEIIRVVQPFDTGPFAPRASHPNQIFEDQLLPRAFLIGGMLLNERAWVGASIGPMAPKPGMEKISSASLGCFVVLTFANGQRKEYGLTNFHVVAPDTTPPSDKLTAEMKKIVRDGFYVSNKMGQAQFSYLQMPSGPDLADFLAYQQGLKDQLLADGSAFIRVKKEIEQFERAGYHRNTMVPDLIERRDMATFLAQERNLAATNRLIARCQALKATNHRLGQVFAASGHRRAGHMLMDWALIDVIRSRAPQHNDVSTNPLFPSLYKLFADTHSLISIFWPIISFGTSP